jgi:hypothetical protein
MGDVFAPADVILDNTDGNADADINDADDDEKNNDQNNGDDDDVDLVSVSTLPVPLWPVAAVSTTSKTTAKTTTTTSTTAVKTARGRKRIKGADAVGPVDVAVAVHSSASTAPQAGAGAFVSYVYTVNLA